MILWRQLKAQEPHSLLFFQMGDFFELYERDAEEASKALGIILTQRANIPMCGIPIERAEDYAERLLCVGFRIAICQQSRPREITRRLSPLLVSEFLSDHELRLNEMKARLVGLRLAIAGCGMLNDAHHAALAQLAFDIEDRFQTVLSSFNESHVFAEDRRKGKDRSIEPSIGLAERSENGSRPGHEAPSLGFFRR
ncbi:MAG TPA: hypothetical protein VME69_10985 [Methylocella sp.]|nr:hypothetical protein [Methylocella sp.]